MSRSTRFRSLALLAALPLIAGGCTSTVPPADTPMPTPPTGLETYYEQTLDYGDCRGFATTAADAKALAIQGLECARLTVPLDYEDPAGKTIELGVLRVRADGDPIGSLVLNPGGPASPGVSFAATMATTAGYQKLYRDFDLVGFDMRGTGSSTPAVDCFTDAERDDDELLASFLFGGETWDEDKTRQVARACAKGSGGEDVVSHLGSRDTARDMDVLRAVLGDSQLTFMGASYGTRLGAVYAEMFPDHLRAMVLDGGMDPHLGIRDRMVQQYAGLPTVLRRLGDGLRRSRGLSGRRRPRSGHGRVPAAGPAAGRQPDSRRRRPRADLSERSGGGVAQPLQPEGGLAGDHPGPHRARRRPRRCPPRRT